MYTKMMARFKLSFDEAVALDAIAREWDMGVAMARTFVRGILQTNAISLADLQAGVDSTDGELFLYDGVYCHHCYSDRTGSKVIHFRANSLEDAMMQWQYCVEKRNHTQGKRLMSEAALYAYI